ncbi:DUF2931 family protein [uncultured Chryseobacterium sp.]|uniref:DUF2931 family protein n=1 Tax=uncultured Chryseobacterium sp. TaxID=259322 RepID=UPI0025EF909F|nr:DUF2931 family protein [uncultured Chryseobacterium sp.]
MNVQYNLTNIYSTHRNYLNKIKLTLISAFFTVSCSKNTEKQIPADHYNWSAGISAPKFYPASNIFVKFNPGGATARVLTGIDPGWGDTAGNFITGDKYKVLPENVYIRYSSGENNFIYEGVLQLPKKKIFSLFNERSQIKHKVDNNAEKLDNSNFQLIVGMAPKGWIRIWLEGNRDFNKVELLKAQLKGQYDSTANTQYKLKNFKNWGKYYTYWQHHGTPSEAWANNEREYYYDMKFASKNKDAKLDRSNVVSSDGWYTSFYSENLSDDINDVSGGFIGKIPVHISVSWQDRLSGKYYDTNIVMPKTLKRLFDETYQANEKLAYSNFIIELENDKQHAVVYLKTKDKVIKLLRFKGEISSKENQDFGDYAYAREIEYFIP